MIGDFLYSITDKDRQSQPVLQRRFNTGLLSVASATVIVDLPPVPDGKVEHVTHCSIEWAAGAAQTFDRGFLHVVDASANVFGTVSGFAAGARFGAAGLMTNLFLFPGERLRVIGIFTGAVANQVIGTTHGILLPKGTFQLR